MARPLVKNVDRQRRPCTVLGCRYYGIPVSQLDRHQKEESSESMVEGHFSDQEESGELNSSLSAKITEIINNLQNYKLKKTAFLKDTNSRKSLNNTAEYTRITKRNSEQH